MYWLLSSIYVVLILTTGLALIAWVNERSAKARLARASVLRRVDASKESDGVFVGCLERHCTCVK